MSKGSRYIRDLFNLSVGVVLLVLIYSCANIGSPNGGPYDEAPPKFVSSTPIPNQVNYKGKSVEILFDELIQIEKPTESIKLPVGYYAVMLMLDIIIKVVMIH